MPVVLDPEIKISPEPPNTIVPTQDKSLLIDNDDETDSGNSMFFSSYSIKSEPEKIYQCTDLGDVPYQYHV